MKLSLKQPQTKIKDTDYEPKRFGLRYNPPQIVLEYFVPSVKKLFHHKIRLPKLKYESNSEEILKEIYDKHFQYLNGIKINEAQIVKLVDKLKSNLKKPKNYLSNSQNSNNELKAKLEKEMNDFKEDFLKSQFDKDLKEQSSKILRNNDFDGIEISEKDGYINDLYQKNNEKLDNLTNKGKDTHTNNIKVSKEFKINDLNDDDEDEDNYEDLYNQFDEKVDLNNLEKEEIDKYKANMEKYFEKNVIKPEDEKYEYDTRKEFKASKVDPDWDIDDDELIELEI